MKNSLALLALVIVLLHTPTSSSYAQWTTDSLAQGRERLAATALGDLVFFAGGHNLGYSNIVEIYNNTAKTWSTAALSVGRTNLVAAAAGERVLFAGGNLSSGNSAVVDIYNITTDAWSTSSLSVARKSLAATSLGTQTFFAGGDDNSGNFYATVDIYDHSTGNWTTAALSTGRVALAGASVGTKVIFAGGFGSTSYSDVVDIYDTNTNLWTTATLSVKREGLSATTVGDKVMFAGGYGPNGYSDVVDIYDSNTNTWTTAKLSSKRKCVAASVNGVAFFAGGDGSGGTGFSDVVDLYDSNTNAWSVSKLSQARGSLAATSLGSKAFFAGGLFDISSGYSPVVDIFDVTCTPPTVRASASTAICLGTSTTLSASGANVYAWEPSIGLSAVTGSSITATPVTTTTYTVKGTLFLSCSSISTVTITVKELPVITVSAPVTICAGLSTTLTASGAATYSWTPIDGLSATTGASVVAKPNITTTYSVTGTGINSCTNSKTVKVTVKPLPVLIINPASPSICLGESTNLTVTGATSYTWSPATGLSATTGSIISASPVINTTYTVTGVTDNCSASKDVIISVKAVPAKPTITATSFDAGTIFLLSSSGSGNNWFINNQAIPGAVNQLLPITTSTAGTYTVRVGQDGCLSQMSDPYLITALTTTSPEGDFTLYPNPAAHVLSIGQHSFHPHEKIEIIIFDLMGRVVFKGYSWPNEAMLDIEAFTSGQYIFQAKQKNVVRRARFLKK
jgi:hypothetical protein